MWIPISLFLSILLSIVCGVPFRVSQDSRQGRIWSSATFAASSQRCYLIYILYYFSVNPKQALPVSTNLQSTKTASSSAHNLLLWNLASVYPMSDVDCRLNNIWLEFNFKLLRNFISSSKFLLPHKIWGERGEKNQRFINLLFWVKSITHSTYDHERPHHMANDTWLKNSRTTAPSSGIQKKG